MLIPRHDGAADRNACLSPRYFSASACARARATPWTELAFSERTPWLWLTLLTVVRSNALPLCRERRSQVFRIRPVHARRSSVPAPLVGGSGM